MPFMHYFPPIPQKHPKTPQKYTKSTFIIDTCQEIQQKHVFFSLFVCNSTLYNITLQ